jgi:hypothetical protein
VRSRRRNWRTRLGVRVLGFGLGASSCGLAREVGRRRGGEVAGGRGWRSRLTVVGQVQRGLVFRGLELQWLAGLKGRLASAA